MGGYCGGGAGGVFLFVFLILMNYFFYCSLAFYALHSSPIWQLFIAVQSRIDVTLANK